MKTYILEKTAKLSIIVLLIVIFGSCRKEPLDVTGTIGPNILELFPAENILSYSAVLLNGKTGIPISVSELANFDLIITGKDGPSIVGMDNSNQSKIIQENGLFMFTSLKGGSKSVPLDFKLIVNANGYVSTSKRIRSFEKNHEIITISLVKIGDTPDGVASKIDNTGSISNGYTISEVKITTPEVGTTFKTKSTVVIPKGVQLKNKSGKTLSGSITSTLVYFNNQTEESLSSFPGGFDANVLRNGNEEGNFTTAGFISLDMLAGGEKVSTFSKPISIITEIPSNTINPETGIEIADGDSISVWSYDTETGDWKYENKIKIEKNSNGIFEAEMKATHLSYWNLDWFNTNSCQTGTTIKIDAKDLSASEYFEFDLLYANSKTLFKKISPYVKNGSEFTFYRAPNTMLIIKPSTNSEYNGELEFNACNGVQTLTLTKKPSNKITVTADVYAYCKNDTNITIRPSGTIYFSKKESNSKGRYIRMIKGAISVSNVEINATYQGYFYYEGKYHYRSFTINSEATHYKLKGEIPNGLGCDK